MLTAGQIVGNYVVEAEIGRGGMARIYRVRHAVLGTHHALKVLEVEYRLRSEVRERFLGEGMIAANLVHPNVVRVTDTVSTPDVAGLVMELVDGPSLEQYIRDRKSPPGPDEIRGLILPILDAVGAAHQRGIVHRDLKPANILLATGAGVVVPKVTDFGIAKVTDIANVAKKKASTHVDARMGTLAYMSPEQVRRAKEVTARSDIFSLGATLYEIATGQVAFDGASDYDVMEQIVHGRFGKQALIDGLDPVIAAATSRALQSSPEARFASCEDFADALRPYATSGVDWPTEDLEEKTDPRRPRSAGVAAIPAPPVPDDPPPRVAARADDTPAVSHESGRRSVRREAPDGPRRVLGIARGAWAWILAAIIGIVIVSVYLSATRRDAVRAGDPVAAAGAPIEVNRPGDATNTPKPAPARSQVAQTPVPAPAPDPCANALAPEHGSPLTVASQAIDRRNERPADSSFYNGAVVAAQQATDVAPTCDEAWLTLAFARYRFNYDICGRGEYSAAEAAAKRAVDLSRDPSHRAQALRMLGRISGAQLHWDESERYFTDSLAVSFDAGARTWLEELSLRKNVRVELLAALKKSLAGELLVAADVQSLTSAETEVLLNAPSARHGRRLNTPVLDWLFYCEGSPLDDRPVVDPGASPDPVVRGTPDFKNIQFIHAFRRSGAGAGH